MLSINERLDKEFHQNSYAYRPGLRAIDALSTARHRCWRYNWVLGMDISKFFDTINHDLLMRAVQRHVTEDWILLYIRRWLKVPYETAKGERIERTMGVPQGSVIGPVLANLFMHYVFDKWMQIHYPHIPFERYADDTICHCRTREEAEKIKAIIMKRLTSCYLKMNEEKTRIVYCKDSGRTDNHANISFDFLGYTFRPRKAKNSKTGMYFTSFLPGISQKSKNHIHDTIRSWQLNHKKNLIEFDTQMMACVRGWINYYGKFYLSLLHATLQMLNHAIVRWALRRFKRFKGSRKRAWMWLLRSYKNNPKLFYHWCRGIVPCYFKLEQVKIRRAE